MNSKLEQARGENLYEYFSEIESIVVNTYKIDRGHVGLDCICDDIERLRWADDLDEEGVTYWYDDEFDRFMKCPLDFDEEVVDNCRCFRGVEFIIDIVHNNFFIINKLYQQFGIIPECCKTRAQPFSNSNRYSWITFTYNYGIKRQKTS